MRFQQLLLAMAFLWGGCSGVPRLPASPSSIQPQPEGDAPSDDGSGEPGSDAPAAAPIAEPEPREPPPTHVLWCYDPTGAACLAASAELGVSPVSPERVPKYLLQGFLDESDDCGQPGISGVMRRLEGPLHLNPGRYVDQVGTSIGRDEVDAIYSGGGCLNSGGAQGEVVKVHAQRMVEGERFLIRIWDGSLP